MVFLLGSVGMLAATNEGSAQSTDNVVTTILDKSIPGRERIRVLLETQHLPAQERAQIYLRAIAEAEDGIAIQSAACAIQQGILAPDLVEAFRGRLRNWNSGYRSAILEYVVDAEAPNVLMPLVRDALRLATTQRPAEKLQLETVILSINQVAAVFVTRGIEQEDIKLLRDAVRAYPEAYIGWLALDKLGAMDEAMYTLARDVYTDAQYGKLARLAAAIASQKTNQDATGAALDVVGSYLREYSLPMEELFPGDGARDWREMDRAQRARLFRMKEEAPTVLLLRFVQSDEARALALEYLDSPNELVADHVQVVAARKWPNDVKANILRIPSSGRAYVLAMLAHFHPDLHLPLAKTGVTADELQASEQKLAKEMAAKPQSYRLLAGM